MDGVYTVGDIARETGVSAERVARAAEQLGIPLGRAGAHARAPRMVGATHRAQLVRLLGAVPDAVHSSLSRNELLTLTSLARAPLGLHSSREVARRTGLSPTTAARCVDRLRALGLAHAEQTRRALGASAETTVLHVDRSSDHWRVTSPMLQNVELPETTRITPRRVPNELLHLFWNTHWSQLFVEHHAPYIARRLVSVGDLDGLAWGATHLPADAWDHAAKTRGLDVRRRRLAESLAADARRREARTDAP